MVNANSIFLPATGIEDSVSINSRATTKTHVILLLIAKSLCFFVSINNNDSKANTKAIHLNCHTAESSNIPFDG